ncbi:MAG: glycerate kinase [Cyclobacteriaceae bacterium]|jgi:glycerate kinase|nr:glycerate kinase [Cyclobacteriaceae bacterium]
MNVLIAPDKFKGTLTASGVCAAVEQGLIRSGIDMNIRKFPLADGGEGTLDIFLYHTGGSRIEIAVHDPLMRRIKSCYGISTDGKTAFIEMARASGLELLDSNDRNPMRTTSFGTGEMIRDALDRSVSEIIISIGGSATNDGALGALCALGARFFSIEGNAILPTGEQLKSIKRIELNDFHPRIRSTRFTAICDVTNPFYGPQGAAYVYAPQKGAAPEEVIRLDEGLQNLSVQVNKMMNIDLQKLPGSGAGGGFAGGCCAFLNARLKPGIEVIFDLTGFDQQINWADTIITGEGKLDAQTLHGKLVAGVSKKAKERGIPVFVICGVSELDSDQLKTMSFREVYSLVNLAGEQEALHNTREVMERLACDVISHDLKQKR